MSYREFLGGKEATQSLVKAAMAVSDGAMYTTGSSPSRKNK